MEFEFTDDQKSLQTLVRQATGDTFGRDDLRAYVNVDRPEGPDAWRKVAADMGLFGLLVPEEHGGAGVTPVEAAIVLEELGARLVPWPYLSTAAVAPALLLTLADSDTKDSLLPRLASGEVVAAVVRSSRAGIVSADSGHRLTGTVRNVLDADLADVLVVEAMTPSGPGLVHIPADAPGVRIELTPGLDRARRLATVSFDGAASASMAAGHSVAATLARIDVLATLLLAAEQVGGMRTCLEQMVEYAKLREQFGRPIGSFQAIKHKCANAFVDTETSRALVLNAVWRFAQAEGSLEDDPEMALLGDLVGSFVSQAFHRVAGENIQVHGGIGFTWEQDAHLFFRRAQSSSRLLDSPSSRIARAAHRIFDLPATTPEDGFREHRILTWSPA